MRIQLTGPTALQCGSQRRPLQKLDAVHMLHDALVKLGHDVRWSKPEIVLEGVGQPVYKADWDLLICVAAPINSLNSLNGLNTLWAISRGGPMMMFWDDWQVKNSISSWRSLVNQGMKQVRKSLPTGVGTVERLFRGCTPEQAEWFGPLALETAKALSMNWRWEWTSLTLRYTWGDPNKVHGLLPVCRSYSSFDPTPVIPLLPVHDYAAEVEHRARAWTCATLTQRHNLWVQQKQKLSWPVHWHGNKKLTEALDGERLATELDVQRSYRKRVGVLSPPYDHAGSGWFRSRFLYAQNTLNVLYGSAAEMGCLGPAYTHYGPRDIEEASAARLLELAHEQREAYRPWLTTYDHMISQVEAAVVKAVAS